MLKETVGAISDAFDSDDDEAAFVDALSTLLRRRRNLDVLRTQHQRFVALNASPLRRRRLSLCSAATSTLNSHRTSRRKCLEWLVQEITRHAWSRGVWPPPSLVSSSCVPEEGSFASEHRCCEDDATPAKRAHSVEDRRSGCSSLPSSSEAEEEKSSSMRDKAYSSSCATEKHVFSMCTKKTPSPRKQRRKKHDLTSYEATLLRARKKLLQAKEKKAKLAAATAAATVTAAAVATNNANAEKTPAAATTTNTSHSSSASDVPRPEVKKVPSTRSKPRTSSNNGSSAADTDSKPSHEKKEPDAETESPFETNRKRILAHLASKGSPWLNCNKFTKLTVPMLAHFFPPAVTTAVSCRTPVAAKEALNKTATSVTSIAYNVNRKGVTEGRETNHVTSPDINKVSAVTRMKEVMRSGMPMKKCVEVGDRSRAAPTRLDPLSASPVVQTLTALNSVTQSTLQSRHASSTFVGSTPSRTESFPKVVALLPKQGRLRPFRPSSPKLPALFQKWAKISGTQSGPATVAAHASMWRRVAGTTGSYGLRSDHRRARKPPPPPLAGSMGFGLHRVPVYRPPARHGNRRASTTDVNTH